MTGVKFAAIFLMLLPVFVQEMAAQPLSVYSEFARIDSAGKVTSPADPREILSPAVARNAFTSFQIVVQPSDDAQWKLYVAQNPENAVQVTLYRESGDRLIKEEQPAIGTGTAVFWMDIWTARTAPVERIKVEPQLNYHGDWVIYPMEGRVMDAQVPNAPAAGWPTGTAEPPAVIANLLCNQPLNAGTAPKDPTPAALRFRNAQQDKALAAQAPRTELANRYGACTATPPAADPEWYYRIRDYLFRLP
jgi:hypothetical protein